MYCHVTLLSLKPIADLGAPEAVISLTRRLNFLIEVPGFLNHSLCEREPRPGKERATAKWRERPRKRRRERKISVLTRKAFQVGRFEVLMTCKCVQMSAHPPS